MELWSFGSPEGLTSPHFGSVSVILIVFQKWGCDNPYVILSRDYQVGSSEIPQIKTFGILEACNFLCNPSIEVRSKSKL